MTHDELLAKINEYQPIIREDSWNASDFGKWRIALRATVQLHKPFLYPEDDCIYCEEDNQPYPCGTIQFIEKELK